MRETAGRAHIFVLTVVAMLATRAPLQAEATWYCGLGPSGQSCAEYHIVTHWTNAGFDLAGTDADPRRLTPPSYQSYSGMITDTYAPSDQEGLNFITAVEQATGIPVYMYNYDSDTALSKLQPGLDKIQVIHNVWVPVQPPRLTSLFTFIFPPGWQPSQRYPIVLSGDGSFTSNNLMFFGSAGTEQTRAIATYVGNSTKNGGTGLIAALSNAGGREAQGWHRNALDDNAQMLTFMQAYGVDRFKVVHFGGSRGGGTALLWGENPEHGTDYTSIGVFAMAPPSHGGFISQQGLASYQGLHGTVIEMFNDPTADRYNRTPRLIDVNPAPTLKLLLDEDRPWWADRPQEDYPSDTNRKSASGYLSYLLNLSPVKGKPVVLSVGTHDAIIPYPMVLKLDRTLKGGWGIPRLMCLTLRTGHNADAVECPLAELDRFLTALVTGQPYTAPDTRRYFQATDFITHAFGTAVELPQQTTLPFTITVPYRLAGFQWATLAACGQTGKPYTATLRDAAGAPVFAVSKTFGLDTTSDFDFDGVGEPDPECDVLRLDQQPGWLRKKPPKAAWKKWNTLAPGSYTWTFTFDGRDINPGNLSYQAPNSGRPTVATTILTDNTEGQPSRQDAVFDPEGNITMGVDEF